MWLIIDDAEACIAGRMSVQRFTGLGDTKSRRRFIEKNDFGSSSSERGDRHGLALAARKRGNRNTRTPRRCAPTIR